MARTTNIVGGLLVAAGITFVFAVTAHRTVGAMQAESFNPTKTFQMLDALASRVQAQVEDPKSGMSDADRKQVLSTLKGEHEELARLIAKHGQDASITDKQLDTELKRFHALSVRTNAILSRVMPKATALDNQTDGPHECSNFCERVCGYNSLGEKICYNRCVKCCNRTSGC